MYRPNTASSGVFSCEVQSSDIFGPFPDHYRDIKTMIRPFDPGADSGAVIDIYLAASRQAHAFLSEEVHQSAAIAVRDIYLPMAETHVFWHRQRPGGFIALIGNEVGGFFVDPALQGHGIGRALMDDAVTRRHRLELDVFTKNTIGRRFYTRYGFVDTGERLDTDFGENVLRLVYPA